MRISRTKPRTKWFILKIDAETWMQLPDDTEGEGVEEVKICLKYLDGGELDSLQDRRVRTRVRGSTATAESDFKYSDFAAQKRALAVVDWEGIVDDETGQKLAITPENMKILPGWLCQWLIDTIDAMSELGEEERGE